MAMDIKKQTSDHFGQEVASFYLPSDLLARLDETSAILGYSRSQCVNIALTNFIHGVQQWPEFQELRRLRALTDAKARKGGQQ